MQTRTIIPPVDPTPADDLETARAARHVPVGTHVVVDGTGLTALQIQHQQTPASRVTALVEVPLGQRLAADQLVAALVALNVLRRNPGDVAALYARLGLLSDHQPTSELSGSDEQAERAAVTVPVAAAHSLEPFSLLGRAAVPERASNLSNTPAVAATGEPTSQTAATEAADLLPCGYGNCHPHNLSHLS